MTLKDEYSKHGEAGVQLNVCKSTIVLTKSVGSCAKSVVGGDVSCYIVTESFGSHTKVTLKSTKF